MVCVWEEEVEQSLLGRFDVDPACEVFACRFDVGPVCEVFACTVFVCVVLACAVLSGSCL